ncbi:DUF962 domain-containing protein [Acinetobacter sp. ANC 4910]|uniref:DUF962 domain-containing protein n=1 Tax=Acinetobacter sp. ANC 4910 TaxID=2529850 RepID=UPI0010395382|nr:DUF962 domain-containing protein [Acinetobacter sp. ANC 4910]TCB33925.1 DUF962 domain-containing protein [Acinetobacter sp. ANC 4910]
MLQNTQELIKNNTQELIKNTVPTLTNKHEVQIVGNDGRIKTLKEFYPFYLSQHTDPTCRRLHFVGTTCVIGIAATAAMKKNAKLLWALPIVGYGFAWVGHFFFEHNKPATFKQPFFSLICDFKMYKDILVGKVDW